MHFAVFQEDEPPAKKAKSAGGSLTDSTILALQNQIEELQKTVTGVGSVDMQLKKVRYMASKSCPDNMGLMSAIEHLADIAVQSSHPDALSGGRTRLL